MSCRRATSIIQILGSTFVEKVAYFRLSLLAVTVPSHGPRTDLPFKTLPPGDATHLARILFAKPFLSDSAPFLRDYYNPETPQTNIVTGLQISYKTLI